MARVLKDKDGVVHRSVEHNPKDSKAEGVFFTALCHDLATLDAFQPMTLAKERDAWREMHQSAEPSRETIDAHRDAIAAAEHSDTWTLAKGGRSLNAGPIRLRAEAHGGDDVAALMTRLVRVPELEREVETLRKLLREACYTLDAVGQQSVADRIRADLPKTKETP